jgi:hypothetical protein
MFISSSPSIRGLKLVVRSSMKYVPGMVRSDKELLTKAQAHINMGESTGGRLKAVNTFTSRIRQNEATVEELQSFDRRIGVTVATSGYRLSDTGCNLDWALISIDPLKAGSNLVRIYLAIPSQSIFSLPDLPMFDRCQRSDLSGTNQPCSRIRQSWLRTVTF